MTLTPLTKTAARAHGFTLVELAIALMVIGILIGGVLKGQELIENARVTATIRDLKDFDSATMIFRNTYGALPGDFRHPQRIPGCTDSLCNVGGNGNGMIGDLEHELYNSFPHLTKAGLLKGPMGGTVSQKDALSPFMGGPLMNDDDMPLELLSLLDDSVLMASVLYGEQADAVYHDTQVAAMFDNDALSENLNDITTASGIRTNQSALQAGGNIRGNLGGGGGGRGNLSIGDNLTASSPTDSDEYTTFFPKMPIDGLAVSMVANARNNHSYFLRPLSTRLADQIDAKLDDGFANSGSITNGLAAQQVLAQADGSDGGLQPAQDESQGYSLSGREGTTDLYFRAAY